METPTLLAFIVAATAIIVVPGPTNMVIVSTAMTSDQKRMIATVAGAATSHILLCIIATVGLQAVLALSGKVFEIIRWVGAVYIIWLGIQQWKAPHVAGKNDEAIVVEPLHRYFLRGFSVNTANPKALIFYGVFFPPFLDPAAASGPQLAILGITFVTIFMVVALLYGAIAARIKRFATSPGGQKLVHRVSGATLISAGGLLIFSGKS